MYYNLKKHKEFFFLDLFVYLIPFAIIIGNLALNSVAVICILVFYTLIFIKKEFVNLYKKYLYILLFLLSFLVLNLLLSSNQSLTSVALINFFKNYSLFLIIFFCSREIKNFNKFFSIILFFTNMSIGFNSRSNDFVIFKNFNSCQKMSFVMIIFVSLKWSIDEVTF